MCPSYLRSWYELLPGRLPAGHRLQKGQFLPEKTFHSGQHHCRKDFRWIAATLVP